MTVQTSKFVKVAEVFSPDSNSGTGSTTATSLNVETLAADKILDSSSEGIQSLLNDTSRSLNINLPSSPSKDQRFVIKNNPSSNNDLVIVGQNVTLEPGEIWEGIYSGSQWIEL